MKRITAMLLSLIVAVAFMPTAAFAANESVQFELSSTKGGGIYSYSMYMCNLREIQTGRYCRNCEGG